MTDYDGIFPETYDKIIKLKGVGEYTAAAISSIAFGEAYAVVDGNVKRVISRIFGIDLSGNKLHESVKNIMTQELDRDNPGDFNQAVMEFGAMHCTPRNPSCQNCIFKSSCFAFKNSMVEHLPLKEARNKPKTRHFSYFVVASDSQNIIMVQRTKNDIWRNLYEFPLIETDKEISPEKLLSDPVFISWFGEKAKIIKSSKRYKHQLTHITIFANFHFVDPDPDTIHEADPRWEIVSYKDIQKYPVSRLIDLFLEDQ